MSDTSRPHSGHSRWLRATTVVILVSGIAATASDSNALQFIGLLTLAVPGAAVLVDWIAGHRLLHQALRASDLRHTNLIAALNEAIVTCDRDGLIIGTNPAACGLLGQNENMLRGKALLSFIFPRTKTLAANHFAAVYRQFDHEVFEVRRPTGGRAWVRLHVVPHARADTRPYVTILEDITEEINLSEHIVDLAERDHLTGLYNRAYLLDRLRVLESQAQDAVRNVALAYIDIDNFKPLNDAYGQKTGDHLLMLIAQEIGRHVRHGDVPARLGGDVYAVLYMGISMDDAERKCRALLTAIATPSRFINGRSLSVSASIGLSDCGHAPGNPLALLHYAELACHNGKRNGGNRLRVFSPEDLLQVTAATEDLTWNQRVRDALQQDHLVLEYEPIVQASTNTIVAHEALVRLQCDGERVRPIHFLPAAERFGLMPDLDRWVISQAIRDVADRRRTNPQARVSINLSGATLREAEIAELVEEQLSVEKVPASALIFEITESVAITHLPQAANLLTRLKSTGCETALDDFGAGMSSFAYLKNLPIDYLKIDGQFVRDIAKSTSDQAMVRAMVQLARALNIRVVAEYVESEAIRTRLVRLGVDLLQGSHFSGQTPPVPLRPMSRTDVPSPAAPLVAKAVS